jgi:hypothetical protein
VLPSPFSLTTATLFHHAGQFVAGSIEKDPDAPFPKTERRRDLSMISALDVGQPHHLALLGVELLEDSRKVETEGQIGRRHVSGRRALVPQPALAATTPPVVDDQVARDAEEKGPELRGILGRGSRAQQAKIRILDNVVGLLRIAEDMRHVPPERRRRPTVERLERRLIHHPGCRLGLHRSSRRDDTVNGERVIEHHVHAPPTP